MTGSVARPRELTVAVIGVGRFGALHARVWPEAGARLVGFCDVDQQRLADVAHRFDGVASHTDVDRLLTELRPDVVVIATSEASHADLAIRALGAGCQVFVEKPLALCGADAWRIHNAARGANRAVVVGQISRFAAPYLRMRASLRDGRVGTLCALRLRRDFSRSWFAAFGDRVHPVWESCIHDIDLAVSFVGRRITRVTALQSAAAGDAAPSVVAGLMEFEGGVITTVESAWLVPDGAPQTLSGALELSGSIAGEAEALGLHGILRQRLITDALAEWTNEGVTMPDLTLWPEELNQVGGALRHEVDYAIGVFTGRREHDLVPLREVCYAVDAAEAMVVSLATNAPVEIRAHVGTDADP